MYLLEFDSKTNLIVDIPTNDSWKGIKDFANLVNDKRFGLEAFSAVALAVDYASIISHYPEKDKPAKAMEIIYGNRKALVWNSDLIQKACKTYAGLQYNPELEEKAILEGMVNNKLQEAREAETDSIKLAKMAEYNKIKKQLDTFNEKHKDGDLFQNAPTRDGYTLSRLEEKMLRRKSFYYDRKEKERQYRQDISAKRKAEAKKKEESKTKKDVKTRKKTGRSKNK